MKVWLKDIEAELDIGNNSTCKADGPFLCYEALRKRQGPLGFCSL